MIVDKQSENNLKNIIAVDNLLRYTMHSRTGQTLLLAATLKYFNVFGAAQTEVISN